MGVALFYMRIQTNDVFALMKAQYQDIQEVRSIVRYYNQVPGNDIYFVAIVGTEYYFINNQQDIERVAPHLPQQLPKILVLSAKNQLVEQFKMATATLKDYKLKQPKPDLCLNIPKNNQESAKTVLLELPYVIDEDFLKEIQSLTPQRPFPSDNPVGNFLDSYYLHHIKQLGISLEEADKSIFALERWREAKRSEENEKRLIQTLPILVLPSHIAQKPSKHYYKNSYLFFPVNPEYVSPVAKTGEFKLAKEHYSFMQCYPQHAKLIILDGIHHALTLAHRNQLTSDRLKSIFDSRNFSQSDIRFGTEALRAFRLYSEGGLLYSPPSSPNDGVLPDFDQTDVVGILGDWGTNLQDAYDIMDELVLNRGVTVLFHDGDVYYAGFPEEFSPISAHLAELRKKVAPKSLRYYAVPGNHDYYTYGGPYNDSLTKNNDPRFIQTKSFFCIKNKAATVQFLGLNTARYDYYFLDMANPFWEGTQVYSEEAAWAIEKIRSFPGKTFIITHHPLFSTFEATSGSKSDMGRKNPGVNPNLAKQFFDVLPNITVWFWGHEHRFSTYSDGAFGLNRAVLVGNSAFQNNEKNYYDIKFPSGDITYNKYHPQLGKSSTDKGWLNHTAIVLGDLTKPEIQADYVYMTASYDKKSVVLKTLKDSYASPKYQAVTFNRPYKLLTDNGLSLAITDRVWLDSLPTDIVFIDPKAPNSNGIIAFNQEFLIRDAYNDNYLNFDGKLVTFGLTNGSLSYRWRAGGKEGTLTTKDVFSLYSSAGNKTVGPLYSKENEEFILSAGSETSRFRVYNFETAKNP